jgi:uncharacterized protein
MLPRYHKNIILLIVCILICGCQGKAVSTYTTYYLPDEEIIRLEHKANNGDLTAAKRLSDFYTFIDYNNRSERLKWLRLLAESGLVNEQYNLAYELLLNSKEIKDQQEGIVLLEKAAECGISYSQKWLAELYETGNIIEKDYCKSKYWYEIVAYRGEIFSMIKLAEFYSTGKCGECNNINALEWLLVAESMAENEFMRNKIKAEKNPILLKLTNEEIDMAGAESKKILKKLTLDYYP